jgi:hypothetical protein
MWLCLRPTWADDDARWAGDAAGGAKVRGREAEGQKARGSGGVSENTVPWSPVLTADLQSPGMSVSSAVAA